MSNTPSSPVKFDNSYTPKVDEYIATCKQNNKKPTVKEFANSLGTDVYSIWAWATKKKKDEKGNQTDELARPKFHEAMMRLDVAEKADMSDRLNAKQETFCKLYATDREFFGNGVQTYIEVYEPDTTKPNWYKNACASASEILRNPKVYTRINELLEDGGLNDMNVDKQLQMLINQHADFGSKIAAIREYNKLKQRITDKIDHTSGGKPLPILGGVTSAIPSNNGNT